MQKPDIGKRLLPLLDIIFILLAFFIILPHGIQSNEILELRNVKDKNKDLEREIAFHEWMNGPLKSESNNFYKKITLTFSENKLYFGRDLIAIFDKNKIFLENSRQEIDEKSWREEHLRKIIERQDANFVDIFIKDVGSSATNTGSIRQVQKMLAQISVLHVVTY